MEISSVPLRYSPAFGEIIYTVDTGADYGENIIDILNSEGTEKIGEKRLEGMASYRVNVSAYVQPDINVTPLPHQESGIITPQGRTASSRIRTASGEQSAIHTGGTHIYKQGGLLSDAPESRNICIGEQDEISLIAEGGELRVFIAMGGNQGDAVTVETGNIRTVTAQSMLTVNVNTEHIGRLWEETGRSMESLSSFTISVTKDGTEIVSIKYRMTHANADSTRICWWNRYGAIDYFTFQNLKSVKKVKSGKGSGISEIKRTVSCPVSTKDTVEWLSQALTAPKVWIDKSGEFIPTEFVTDEMAVFSEDATEIEVTLKCEGDQGL